MKILKEGSTKKNWTAELICQGRGSDPGCGATLLVELDDVFDEPPQNGTVLDRTLGERIVLFRCPCCLAPSLLPDRYVTPQVRRAARLRRLRTGGKHG